MRRLLVGLVCVVVVVGSCGADDGESASGAASLEGRTFLSQAVTEGGAERPLVPGTTVRIEFADGEVRVNAGCNHLFGTLHSTDDGLLDVSQMGGTEMGCDPDRHAQDDWIATFLSSGPAWSLDGDRLVLAGETTEITLLDRLVADPDLPLEGTRWLVDTIVTGDVASSTPGSAAAYLELQDGQVVGSTGCNELMGSYEIDGSELRLIELSQTDMACESDAMSMEASVIAALDGTVEFTIVAQRLTLVAPSGAGLGFHAET